MKNLFSISKSLGTNGVLAKKDLPKLPGVPSRERLKKGPVAVIECTDTFPCNPCEGACPEEAIKIGEDITNLPFIEEGKCTGCGSCIPVCPGLAIFVVDLTYSEKEAVVRIPHEFIPLPSKDELVKCLNRRGEIITDGRIVRVVNANSYDRTPIIWVAVLKKFAMDVRAIKVDNYSFNVLKKEGQK